MKKTILIVLAAFACQYAFSQTQVENVIHYVVDENGNVDLTIDGNGYLYKSSNEGAYYLYTHAEYISFDFASMEDSNKRVELTKAKQGDFWPKKKGANGEFTDCNHPNQPFHTITENNISLFRNPDRPSPKDEFSIDGLKVFAWAPERGAVEFTVGDTTVTRNSRIVIRKDTTLAIHGNKHGSLAVLKAILINGKEIPTKTYVDGRRIERIPPQDGFMHLNSTIYPQKKDTVITRETKPFKVSLKYDYLDDYYNLHEGIITVYVDVDIKRKGLPLGVWIPLVSLGGVLFILFIIFWSIRTGKKGKSKKDTADAAPVAGILLDFNHEGTKGKAVCEWYPERELPGAKFPTADVRNVDLSKVERVVFILSRSRNTEKAWKKNEDENLRILDVIPREELLDLLNQIDKKRNDGLSVRIITQNHPEENILNAWIYAQVTHQKLCYKRINLMPSSTLSENADNKPIDDTTAEKPSQGGQPLQPAEEGPQQSESKDDKGIDTSAVTQDKDKETQTETDSEARINELSEKLRLKEEQLTELNSSLDSYKKQLEKQDEALIQRANEIQSKQKEIDIANLKIEALEDGKAKAEKRASELADSLLKEKQDLEEEKKEHDKTKGLLATTIEESAAKIEDVQKRCTAEIESAKKECTEQVEAEKARCSSEIKQIKESCESRLVNWQADKNTFLDGICKPIERLYGISDDIYSDLDESNRSFSQYMEYIVNNLKEFSEKVQKNSDADGIWRNGTNAEAEKSIRTELTGLISINSSWVNAIARLYCYSRVPEIGDSFESTGIHVADIDTAYRDMVSLLGRYGITVIIPRILVDYYDDMSKKYFAFNNEDNAISKFVDRDVLIKNQAPLKIYDMGRIAYYLDGEINKGEIVYF